MNTPADLVRGRQLRRVHAVPRGGRPVQGERLHRGGHRGGRVSGRGARQGHGKCPSDLATLQAYVGMSFSLAFMFGPIVGTLFASRARSSGYVGAAPAHFAMGLTLLELLLLLCLLPETGRPSVSALPLAESVEGHGGSVAQLARLRLAGQPAEVPRAGPTRHARHGAVRRRLLPVPAALLGPRVHALLPAARALRLQQHGPGPDVLRHGRAHGPAAGWVPGAFPALAQVSWCAACRAGCR